MTITAAKRLLIFPQDKGGIGKSFVATLLHDYLSEQNVRIKAFDLDHANSTFNRFVPDATFIDTDVDSSRLGALDTIVEALSSVDVVLVDNRASGGTKVIAYLNDTRLPDLQVDFNCALVFVIVATNDKDAISQVAELIDQFGERVGWLIARNLRDGGSLPLFEQSKSRNKLLELGAIEVDVPCLSEVTRNRLQTANLTVGRGRLAPELHLLDRSRCMRFHQRMTTEFAKAQVLLVR